MNWRKWKAGLFVAAFIGFADSLSVFLVAPNAQVLQVLALAVGKAIVAAGLYMKQHPVEEIQDTQFIYGKTKD